MWNSLMVMAGAGVLAVPLAASVPSSSPTATSSVTLLATTSGSVSQATANSLAVQAVGGGTVVHSSQDQYLNQAVYDIHVLYQSQVWDVKVGMNGKVLLKKLSSEQPASNSSSPPPTSQSTSTSSSSPSSVTESAAEQTALKAVGGGTVTHASADHTGGVADWDIHITYNGQIWDVKVAMSSGQVLSKKLSTEQPTSSAPPSKTSPSKESEKPASSTPSSKSSGSGSDKHPAPTTMNGITFNQKLTTVPSQFSQDVASAVSAVNGVSVKWVKFQSKSHGDFQMNIKIHLNHGTTKVKDIFNASGQLVAQKLPNGK